MANAQSVRTYLTDTVLAVVGSVPQSHEAAQAAPHGRAQLLARQACRKAATISGGAALVPGPFGMLTVLPDLLGVWKVQAQMVADIAAVYGKSATLGKEQMLYCLFRHLASQGLRDVVARAGERFLVRRAPLQVLRTLAAMVGVQLTQRAAQKAIARYAPLVGAAGVAAYAFYDTRKVAQAAMELFGSDATIEEPLDTAPAPA